MSDLAKAARLGSSVEPLTTVPNGRSFLEERLLGLRSVDVNQELIQPRKPPAPLVSTQ